MKVCIFHDEFGTSGQTSEQEYEYTEGFFRVAYPEIEFTFVRDITPQNFQRCDVYIIDVGGIGLKDHSHMSATMHLLNRLIEDNPSTMFVLWSYNTVEWFDDLFPNHGHPNLKNGMKNSFWDEFEEHFNLGE